MPFILVSDIENKKVATRFLQPILTREPDLFDECVNTTEIEITQYLGVEYDLTDVLSATGNDRNPVLLEHAANMVCYYLFDSVSDAVEPTKFERKYARAIQWLKDVQQGRLQVDFPQKMDAADQEINQMRFGSLPKQKNTF